MSLRDFFLGIESVTEAILTSPLDAVRTLELDSWFLANALNWIFVIIGFAAMIFWLKQLKKYNEDGDEDRSSTSHSYLG
tara:strand:- start:240801 stop:241037 length:237 start_codon:yes stop_codon:yes gene_type:complete